MGKAILLALGAIAFATPSWGHGDFAWIQERDKRTGDACCGEHDCYKVKVEYVNGGYAFRHANLSYSVSYREAKQSEDGEYWACIPRPGFLRCFFAPPLGS
jgi:hypothetical protein